MAVSKFDAFEAFPDCILSALIALIGVRGIDRGLLYLREIALFPPSERAAERFTNAARRFVGLNTRGDETADDGLLMVESGS